MCHLTLLLSLLELPSFALYLGPPAVVTVGGNPYGAPRRPLSRARRRGGAAARRRGRGR